MCRPQFKNPLVFEAAAHGVCEAAANAVCLLLYCDSTKSQPFQAVIFITRRVSEGLYLDASLTLRVAMLPYT